MTAVRRVAQLVFVVVALAVLGPMCWALYVKGLMP